MAVLLIHIYIIRDRFKLSLGCSEWGVKIFMYLKLKHVIKRDFSIVLYLITKSSVEYLQSSIWGSF